VSRSAHSIGEDLNRRDRTLSRVWERRVRSDADAGRQDATFLWHPDRAALSTAALDHAARATAAGLAERGLGEGDRICLLMRNSPELIELMLASWRIGALVVPLSPQLEGRLLHERIAHVEPAIVVADAELAGSLAHDSQSDSGRAWTLVVNGGDGLDGGAEAGGIEAGDGSAREERRAATTLERLRRPELPAPHADVSPQSPALILFTSGTSGRAKGCVLSHHYAVYYSWVFWRHIGYECSDTLYTCLPLNHCHALFSSFWPAVLAGARIAVSPRFSASRFWREIADSEASACAVIGTMSSILLARERDEHESRANVRIAHVSPDGALDMPRFQERFGLKAVTCLYGSTEVMVFPPLLELPPVPGLIGPAPSDWDVALLDEAGFALDGPASGELAVRPRLAHTMFDGYYGLPEATAHACRDLWFHTGDILRRDRAGLYWFVGRSSDTIRRRGENVSAWEVESAIAEHASVEEVAAFPLPSPLGGEDICLVLVRRAHDQLDEAAVAEHYERTLPRYMRPDRIWVRERELPKNAGGKADKARLREEYGRLGEAAASAVPAERA
jgi:carnitine-CoA ligase